MFVLELSKPGGVCLAACAAPARLVGYLICSRYDDVWHVMNVAVDPAQRAAGSPRSCCGGCSSRSARKRA